ncbi:MAG: hypothetical protein AAB719_02600, partial [Patescibacteria group bacterium]
MLMDNHIFVDGKEFISAVRASKKIGYASDYVGQLCRAKKVPGKLIGKTWYVDFQSLLEHRKNRKLGKKRKVQPESILNELRGERLSTTLTHKPFEKYIVRPEQKIENRITKKLPEVILPQLLNSAGITYEKEEISRLPELNKKVRRVESVWGGGLLKRASIASLILITAISAHLSVLEQVSPSVATEVRQVTESIGDIGGKFVSILPNDLVEGERLVAISIFSGIENFFENIVTGFRSLRDLALNKIFFKQPRLTQSPPSPKITRATSSLSSKAITETTNLLSLNSLRSELKTELENYIDIKINSLSPSVNVYQSFYSTPTNLELFRDNEVVPVIYRTVTNQSTSDVEHLSSGISNLVTDGSFIRATFDTICLSADNCIGTWPTGGSGTFAWTPTSYGVSTSTTLGFLNGFLSTASSTFTGGFIADRSTTTSATTTNLFATTASTTNFFGSGLTNCTGNNYLTWSGGLFGCDVDDTSVGGGTFAWTPQSWGVSTTTTLGFFNGFISTASSTFTGGFLANRSTTTEATSTNFFTSLFGANQLRIGGTGTSTINSSGDLFVIGSTTLQNFTFINATGTQATTTNFFSTNLFASVINSSSLAT